MARSSAGSLRVPSPFVDGVQIMRWLKSLPLNQKLLQQLGCHGLFYHAVCSQKSQQDTGKWYKAEGPTELI